MYIQDVMIDPEHRRTGLAALLVAHIRRRAEAWGCRRLYLTSEPDNHAAHAAWLAMGFRNVPGEDLVDGVWVTRDFKGPGKHRALYEHSVASTPASF